mgnify:CR=1 FL=1
MVRELKNEYAPDVVSPPGVTLLDTIEAIGMNQKELAARTGRTPKTINRIIKGEDPITPETALQLARVLGIPASFWNNRESAYREYLARVKEREKLRKQIEWLKDIPVSAMIKLGWIERHDDKVSQSQEVLDFFGVASPEQWKEIWLHGSTTPMVSYRKSPIFKSKPGSVAAWLRKGELEAQKIECAEHDQSEFKNALTKIKPLTLLPPEEFQPELTKICASCGVCVVFVEELPGVPVSGATYWITPNKALLQLSYRYKSDDHLWFSFYHEAGHIILHGKRDAILETEDQNDSKEKEADRFAADMLIPPIEMRRFIRLNNLTEYAIVNFAREIDIAPGIVVGRLQHDAILPFKTAQNKLKRKLKWN